MCYTLIDDIPYESKEGIMADRNKRPPVDPELGRKWLQRYEAGESPPRISTNDGFDVRTVRKHIELARQRREMHEARSVVLRNALERHYDDLCKLAQDIDSAIVAERRVSLSMEANPILLALRQHLPRSPLWKNLAKWDDTHEELAKMEEDAKRRLGEEISSDERLGWVAPAGADRVVMGIVDALVFQLKAWAQGWQGIDRKDGLVVEPAEEGLVNVRYGPFHMGKVSQQHIANIREVIVDFEAEITAWPEYENLQRGFAAMEHLKSALRDELAVIILRRVVPGRCKYCPI
jgi:hypothetical protein